MFEQDWAQDNNPCTGSQPAVFVSRLNHAIKCHVLRKLFSIGTHALCEVTVCTTGVRGAEGSDVKGWYDTVSSSGSGKIAAKIRRVFGSKDSVHMTVRSD